MFSTALDDRARTPEGSGCGAHAEGWLGPSWASGAEVHDHRQQVGCPPTPSTSGVGAFFDNMAQRPVLEPVDHPDLPQRLGAVEVCWDMDPPPRACAARSRRPAQGAPVCRRVVLDVEVQVRPPHTGRPSSKRDRFLTFWRYPRHTRSSLAVDHVDDGLPNGGGGPSKIAIDADVHVRDARPRCGGTRRPAGSGGQDPRALPSRCLRPPKLLLGHRLVLRSAGGGGRGRGRRAEAQETVAASALCRVSLVRRLDHPGAHGLRPSPRSPMTRAGLSTRLQA